MCSSRNVITAFSSTINMGFTGTLKIIYVAIKLKNVICCVLLQTSFYLLYWHRNSHLPNSFALLRSRNSQSKILLVLQSGTYSQLQVVGNSIYSTREEMIFCFRIELRLFRYIFMINSFLVFYCKNTKNPQVQNARDIFHENIKNYWHLSRECLIKKKTNLDHREISVAIAEEAKITTAIYYTKSRLKYGNDNNILKK